MDSFCPIGSIAFGGSHSGVVGTSVSVWFVIGILLRIHFYSLSEPGYFYRDAEDGIIDTGFLPVIGTQEILALGLYRDGLFLGD